MKIPILKSVFKKFERISSSSSLLLRKYIIEVPPFVHSVEEDGRMMMREGERQREREREKKTNNQANNHEQPKAFLVTLPPPLSNEASLLFFPEQPSLLPGSD